MKYPENQQYVSVKLTESSNDDGLEMFPLLSDEQSYDLLEDGSVIEDLPILPVKNTVLFPGVIMPITVGRKKSIRLVKKAYKGDRRIGVIAQENAGIEEPKPEDLYQIGTIAHILKMLVLPDGNTTIIIQGRERFEISKFTKSEPFITAQIKILGENFNRIKKREIKAMVVSLKESATTIMRLNPEIPQEAQIAIDNIESPSFLTHFLSANINADVSEKQSLLEIHDGMQRATRLLKFLHKDIQILEIKNEIQDKVHSDIDQQQRDYYLRQQIKVLQDELGDSSGEQEIALLRRKAEEKQWSKSVAEHFHKELDRASRMNSMAAEYPVALGYLELMITLPWNEFTSDAHDLNRARKVLNRDHYGLEKVKERVIEYLSVLKLKQDMKSPILCFYGPPGVGKTSLGRSIASALNRRYARIALGGLHDEAEIRGHRKTYVGALPGKIIQNLKKVGASNPVFILDEIDKVSSDMRGDPASALLEVLDPEQNHSFTDNYLDVEYDLSHVLFIATANRLDTIHPALRDRMEIIEINGYTVEEKLNIAKKHLIPEQRKEHGLKAANIRFTDKGIVKIIENYTRESGVRNLKRQIGAVCRKIATYVASETDYQPRINQEQVRELLGSEPFDREQYEQIETPGIVTGLAWTQVGGEILFIEVSLSKGKGKMILSGQLGDVMKESASAAFSYLKANNEVVGIPSESFAEYDLHIHVPAGAVPKDGPSAGIAILTALTSAFTQRKVKDHLAMTGEITLSGRVLPVGGIKEKILAAKRAGITDVILSKRNLKDVEEIDTDYLKGLQIHYVSRAQEVLELALQAKS